MQTPQLSANLRGWLAVAALGAAAFIFNTSEFVPVGLLTDIGLDFHITDAHVGLMLTIYAWVVASISVPLMLLTGKVERKRLITGVFALFVVSHLICAVASSFAMLLLGRIGIACSHAVFWSIAISMAVRVAPEGRQAMALCVVATGTTMAMVLGVPLGRIVGELVGWRSTFLLIGVSAALVLASLRVLLPKLPSVDAGSLKDLPLLMQRPALVSLYALTALIVTAHFIGYTYIEPFAVSVAHLSGGATTVLLLMFGAAGVFGSMLFNRYYVRRPKAFLSIAIGVILLCLLMWRPLAISQSAIGLHSIVWGAAIIAFGLSMQAWILRLAKGSTDLAMSLYSSIYNVGIGAGALVGGQLEAHYGLSVLGYAGSAFAVLALVVCVLAFHADDVVPTVSPSV